MSGNKLVGEIGWVTCYFDWKSFGNKGTFKLPKSKVALEGLCCKSVPLEGDVLSEPVPAAVLSF